MQVCECRPNRIRIRPIAKIISKIISKSINAFSSNPTNRQTDRQTDRQTNNDEKHDLLGGVNNVKTVTICTADYVYQIPVNITPTVSIQCVTDTAALNGTADLLRVK